MNLWKAYWHLMRFDKPAGILLLWYPTACALWLANHGRPSLSLVLLFFTGTVLMRAAGCVFNDIVDRNIDKHIRRTQLRPITSGAVTVTKAYFLLMVLLSCALLVVINLPGACLYWAIVALVMTLIYPFCKRFLSAPQMMLGLTFSMGIPMAYVASGQALDSSCFLLFFINFLWILSYDTMYAMADREDDLKIGVHSTAIYFAHYDRVIVGLLNLSLHTLWLYWAIKAQVGNLFYIFWFIAGFILLYQQKLIHSRIPEYCFKAFVVSIYYGFCIWMAVVIGLTL